jgi:hypothetical protein
MISRVEIQKEDSIGHHLRKNPSRSLSRILHLLLYLLTCKLLIIPFRITVNTLKTVKQRLKARTVSKHNILNISTFI